jgi:hypothetical protein
VLIERIRTNGVDVEPASLARQLCSARCRRHGRVYALEDSERSVIRAGTIADDLPLKASAHLSKSVRLGVAKYDGVPGVEGDNELITVASKCNQPSRAVDIRGQLNLP